MERPRFKTLTTEYRDAFDQGMQRHIEEIEAIATSTEPATFANTIEAMENW